MEKKERLQNIWAMTDKPLIDIMTRKSQQLPTTGNKEYSSEGSSDSDSDSNSDFTALPEEFRPNININKPRPLEKGNDAKTSPNQTTLRKQLIQSPTSAFRKPTKNAKSSNRSSPENQKLVSSECEQTSSIQNNKELSAKGDDSSVPKTGNNSKIRCQIVKNMIQSQQNEKCNKISENGAVVRRKTLSQQTLNDISKNQLLPQPNAVTSANERKSKKSLKYEYVQKEKQQTIQLNFDILSFKDTDSVLNDGLKYETKLIQNTRRKHKNATENRIIKRSSRKFREIPSLPEGQFPISLQKSIVKWDSSLSLNSDDDNKIEWTFIREEKTLLTTRRRVADVSANNGFVPQNYNYHTRPGNSLNRKFTSLGENETGCNQNAKPKTIRKGKVGHTKFRPLDREFNPENFAYKNNLHSKNSDAIKYVHSIRNLDFNTKIESWDAKEDIYVERRSICTQNAENTLSRSASSETLDLTREKSLTDDRSCNKEMKLSPRNKKQNSFAQFQQAPYDLTLPAKGVSYGRRENSEKKESRDFEIKRDSILWYGKEISDFIIGSYTALSMFTSFYREWTLARRELIFHFEQLGKNLIESSKSFSRYTDVINTAKTVTDVAQNIPHPTVAIAAKVVSVITSLLQTFLKTKKEERAINTDDSDEITKAMLKDTNSTAELYMYGLQCSQQFEETTKLIEEFHSNENIHGYFDNENPEITTFIRGLLEFKPNHRVFYKKLHKCFQELLQTSTTSFSKRFCEPFTLCSSSAVDVIGYLGWRFRNEDFDGASVSYELKEIHNMIENNRATGVEDLQKRIQNCVRILREELEFMESCIKDISLFDSSSDYSK